MTTARAEQPGTIPGRVWPGTTQLASEPHTSLIAELVTPGDRLAEIGIVRDGDEPVGAWLTPAQLREIAADLIERAEALENVPGRNRKNWRWHLREGERLLSETRNHVHATDAIRRAHAHFQAAAVLRGHTTVHIHHESEGDTT